MRQQSDAVCGFGHANTCATGTPLLKCISRLPWVCHRSDALPCEFVSLVVWLLIVCMAHAAHDTQSCGTNIMITQSNVCVCLSFLVLYTCSSPFLLLCVCGRTGCGVCVCSSTKTEVAWNRRKHREDRQRSTHSSKPISIRCGDTASRIDDELRRCMYLLPIHISQQ